MYNGRFCRDTVVNFTLVDLGLIANGTLDIEGLLTHNITDPDERIGNMSSYSISNCMKGNSSITESWLISTHMNSSWMEEQEDEAPSIGDWMCLVGLRFNLHSTGDVPAPHMPHGWMVCCGLWCHTTIPYPLDRKTSGWCTLVEMIPFMGATPGDSPVEMIQAHGHLEFGRHKREVTV